MSDNRQKLPEARGLLKVRDALSLMFRAAQLEEDIRKVEAEIRELEEAEGDGNS